MIIEWLDKSDVNGASYSNEAAKSVSDCVVGRANGTERRGEAERPKSQSSIENWSINCYYNNRLPLLKEMEEGKSRDAMLQKLLIKHHQQQTRKSWSLKPTRQLQIFEVWLDDMLATL